MHWQALFLLLVVLSNSDATKRHDDEEISCNKLQEEWRDNGAPYSEDTLNMVLLWNDELGHAAAALLRATLAAAGYNADSISLHNSDSINLPADDSDTLTVEVTMAAQLQVRLTSGAASSSACRNVSWSFYQDMNTLRNCDFIIPETNNSAHAYIYIMNEWNNTCTAEIIRHSTTTASSARVTYLDRYNLTDVIRSSNSSFFFLDTYSHEQQINAKEMRLVQLPPTANDTLCALTPNNTVLLKYAGGLLPETFVVFSPSLNDLFSILDEYHMKNQSDINEIACRWALRSSEQFKEWRISALIKPRPGLALALICQTETKESFEELRDMTTMIKGYTNSSLTAFVDRESIAIKVGYYDCNDIDLLLKRSIIMHREGRIRNLEAVILTENMARALASYAAKLDVPLLAYDVSSSPVLEPAVRSATGRVKHLELAMRRLLVDCGWQRLAVISEPTQLAIALSAALRAPTTRLTVREINVTSSSCLDIPRLSLKLKELLDDNARVFLVNTEAATAAALLTAAVKLNITPEKGYVWIVREYDTADNMTSVLSPYSVSFWWRGERKNETSTERGKIFKVDSSEVDEENITYEVALHKKLDERWRDRAWPLHAAPLLDALLTLREGVRRYQYTTIWSWPRAKNVSSFWNIVQRQSLPGINQKLSYDEGGVVAPLVFLQQWGTEPRPRLVATWRGGEGPEHSESCPAINPPHDGSKFCLIASGDPFNPKCLDIIWIPCAIFATLIGTTLIVAATRYFRKAVMARDLRIKTKFAKQLLARRERVFEALAEHLIDRSALELLQELGTGRFGRVHLGLLRESGSKHQNVVVAAKALREEASSAEESEFLREACTLAKLHHDNIIRFLGVCVVDGPPLLLMEHAFFGDLLHYLQTRRCLAEGSSNADSNSFESNEKKYVSAKSLTKLAQEAATAIAYLAERGIVHRDLRASNCLVDERRCLKLADFGLARATGVIDGEYACRRGLFPVLWMAPESLAKGVSSAASDVWSFGVLVFELVTLGRRPYGVQPPPTVLRHVLAGGQPQLPWDASAETRALTRSCWRRKPEDRPTAARLADWLNTHWRALRPALVTEFVDVDSNVFGNDSSDFDLSTFGTPPKETFIAQ